MAIKLSKETQAHLLPSIKQFMETHLDEEIGDLKAMLLLEFFVEEIGPSVYNQAIADAQAYLNERVSDLGSSCYEPEFGYWQR